MPRILLVDDDEAGLRVTRRILELEGWEVVSASDGQAALELVRSQRFDLIVTDVRMPRMGGLEFLRAMRLSSREIPVILMTAYGRVEDAVWAMKMGAVDFLTKPFKRQDLVEAVRGILTRLKPLHGEGLKTEILGDSPAIRKVLDSISRVSNTDVTVFIQGESGSGKELVARAIHNQSSRSRRPFLAVNCAALPEALLEAELFGYERGAFTGAHSSKVGLFEAAEGGTLFLDEIGDLPLSLQPKLLRVLQENEVRRIGANTSRKINVRVLSASHQNLRAMVSAGRFREDLLYRLEVVLLPVPALRERKEDLPLLISHFVKLFCERHHREHQTVSTEVLSVFQSYAWPGNIRELANVLERAVVFSSGPELRRVDLPAHLQDVRSAPSDRLEIAIVTPLKEVEELLIRKTLEATSGDRNLAAQLLGVHSRTIHRKLERDQ